VKKNRPMKPHRDAVWDEKNNRWAWDVTMLRRKMSKLRKMIRAVKPSRVKENKAYAAIKIAWASVPKNQFCQAYCKLAGIITKALPYPHHVRGRGKLLNDIRFWLPVCAHCHDRIEKNRAEARKHGFLKSRDRKAMQQEGIQCHH
jgi:hypothetical protein